MFGRAGDPLPSRCRQLLADFRAKAGIRVKAVRDRDSRDGSRKEFNDGMRIDYADPDFDMLAGARRLALSGTRSPLGKAAMDKQEWRWWRGNCPEAVVLRDQLCKDRFCKDMDPKYACMGTELGALPYTAEPADAAKARGGAAPAAQGAAVSQPADVQKKPFATEKLKEGAEKLRKFLKF